MRNSVPDTFMARGKGDVISKAELQALVGVAPADVRYSLRICAIAAAMERMKRAAGQPCTIIQSKSDLKILTDAESATYNKERSDVHVAGLRRAHRRNCEVQSGGLTEEQRNKHDRDLVVTGARVAVTMGHAINRLVNLRPAERSTPGAESYGVAK